MNCNNVTKYVYVYLDGEFDALEREQFEAHVGECESCRYVVSNERAFQQAFRQTLKKTPAPDHLRSRIKHELKFIKPAQISPSTPTWSWGWRLAPMALAAAIALVIMWPLGAPTNSTPVDVTTAGFVEQNPSRSGPSQVPLVQASNRTGPGFMTLASYNRLPADVRGNEPDISKYMAARVPFHVAAPLKQSKHLRLFGARQVAYKGTPAVLFLYEFNGDRVGVLQFAGGKPRPRGIQLYREGTVTYGRFNYNGQTYAVFSEIAPNILSRLLPR